MTRGVLVVALPTLLLGGARPYTVRGPQPGGASHLTVDGKLVLLIPNEPCLREYRGHCADPRYVVVYTTSGRGIRVDRTDGSVTEATK